MGMNGSMNPPGAAAGDPQATPAGTPDGAPPIGQPQAVPQAPLPAPDVAAIQRWNTQLSQQNALVRTELGLARDASNEDIKAALAALKQQRMPTPDNVTEDDPEVSKTRALWVDRLWEAEQRYYGDVAVDSRSLWETARTSNDPREFTSLVYSVAQRIAESMVAGSPEGQPADAPPNRPTNALAGSEAPLAPVSADLRELDSTGRLEEAFRRGYARLTR